MFSERVCLNNKMHFKTILYIITKHYVIIFSFLFFLFYRCISSFTIYKSHTRYIETMSRVIIGTKRILSNI